MSNIQNILTAQSSLISNLTECLKKRLNKDVSIAMDPNFNPPQTPFMEIDLFIIFQAKLDDSAYYDQMVKIYSYSFIVLNIYIKMYF